MKLRRRKFVNHKKRIMYFSLFFMLLFISIGYAYLSAALSITGHTELSSNTWNIHFENLSVKTGSVTATTPAAIQSNTTSINYSVELGMPGDFYEFEVDIVNGGTLPGKISLVNIQGISSAALPYLESSIKYTNGIPVQVDDLLNPNSSKRLVVRVGYIEDLNTLPEDDIELDLTFTIDYSQTNEEEITTDNIIQQLKTENSSCFTKYEGQVTDQVGQTVTANNVYFNKCADKRNIIFNNMCWQMIRTTETGGVKMIYNGDVVDGKCESSRGDHKGLVGESSSTQTLNASYLYGDSFTYDTTNNTFTLTDTITATWSNSTYENLLGKFTCKTTSDTCTTIYQINGYSSNTQGDSSAYTIGDTNYAQIGKSSFNANNISPAMVGYMFNKSFVFGIGSPSSSSLKGNDVSYANGTYTLLPASGENSLGTTLDATHHYTCNNTSGGCNKVRFYIRNNVYLELNGENNIDEAVESMLYADDVNKYNSTMKGIIDAWYKNNLNSKTYMLEDTVYCNARNITNPTTSNFSKDGSLTGYLYFKNNSATINLNCPNVTDQFAVSNNKAKLTYPVALLQAEERHNINTPELLLTGLYWYTISPRYFNTEILIHAVSSTGTAGYTNNSSFGIRPVVTLGSGTRITSGDGSEESPFIIS